MVEFSGFGGALLRICWKDNIKMDLKEINFDGVARIRLAPCGAGGGLLWTYDAPVELRIRLKVGYFLAVCAIIGFSIKDCVKLYLANRKGSLPQSVFEAPSSPEYYFAFRTYAIFSRNFPRL
jgi:hypothetical protein